MKRHIPVIVLLLFTLQVSAQRRKRHAKKEVPVVIADTVPFYRPVTTRQLFHDNIVKEQQLLLASDGKADKELAVGSDARINETVTDAATKKVDWMRYEIETSKNMDQRLKANYLSGLADILRYVRLNWRKKEVNADYLPQIIASYKQAIAADVAKESIVPVVQYQPYDVAYTATLPRVFKDNVGYGQLRDLLLIKLSQYRPERTFNALKAYPESPAADSLLRILGHSYPQQLYDYVQANNKLSYRIQNIQGDALIENIVRMARDPNKNGQYYFPFLDNIVKGKTSIKEVDNVKNDPVQYFRLLVKTRIDYVGRAAKGDTAIGFIDLEKRLTKKAEDDFVAKINGLHESPDAVRFRSIQPLSPEELYYVAVLTHGLIYTSSYTNGVYPLMMKKAGNKGDELLKSVNFDRYRKFISQAAAYNTLKNFLGSFANPGDAHTLMNTFVSRLEKSNGLEDGVDVADSYASVYETLPDLAKQMLINVKDNYERNQQSGNRKGIAIYKILYELFLSADSTNNVDLTKELKIPPVYSVPFSSLVNQKGEVISQVFFYGDQDGRNIFNGFLGMFSNANWKIDGSNKQWVVIRSVKGNPVSIYANRPLDENKGEDDAAQRALCSYLDDNNLQPTITIHRGHSYYAPTTIDYMFPSSKIVFMGSCGGFNLIDSILRKSDDAQIIASKQIGKTAINKPFFIMLTDQLRSGRDIEWIPFWKEFKKRANVPGFEDYIPPYKNLGAIFIKAYKRETGETDV